MKVVVTGGTKGIGRAIAETFAGQGHDVAVCARNAGELQAMRKDFWTRFPASEILVLRADMSKTKDVIKFAEHIQKSWPSIDILVNNAGVFIPGAISSEPEGALESMIETNLYSAYHMTRALLPGMVEQGKGHIFNMCSVASMIAYPNGGPYSISKFALLGFSKVLREELKGKGIKVTAVLPGATWSNSWAGVDLPESRLMQANDIALAILSATNMSPAAVVEEIVIRPQLGDL